MVQESIRQTQARYRLAELAVREKEVKKNLENLRAEEQALRSPARLAMLAREKGLPGLALGRAAPEAADWEGRGLSRRPGDVLDKAFAVDDREAGLAAGNWR